MSAKAIHLPSGEGTPSKRMTLAPVVSCSAGAETVGRRSGGIPTRRVSSVRTMRLLPSPRKRAARARTPSLRLDADPAAVADGGDEDMAAGDEDDAVAVRRDVPGGQVIEGFRHPSLAHLVEVRGQGDGQSGVLARGDVEDAQVGHELVGDPSGVEAGRAGVEALVEGVLLEPAALEVHRPDVHGAVAVAQEVDPVLPDHRVLARAGVIRGQGRRPRRAPRV